MTSRITAASIAAVPSQTKTTNPKRAGDSSSSAGDAGTDEDRLPQAKGATMVDYEWCVETVLLDSGDIEELDFMNTLRLCEGLARELRKDEHSDGQERDYRIVLVRSEGNEHAGVTDRLWAYFKDGQMPEYFSNGLADTKVRVPKKYRREAERWRP